MLTPRVYIMTESIEQDVKQVISGYFEVDIDVLTGKTHFVNDLDIDSLDALDLLLVINEEFNTHIPPENIEDIHTVADMVAAVEADKNAH